MFTNVQWTAVLIFLAAAFFTPAHARAEGRLEATLESPYAFDHQRSAVVRLTLRNTGDAPVTVYKWDTPFAAAGGRLPRSQFVVTNSAGVDVRYRGRWVNMGPIFSDQFYTVRPGDTLSKEVDLIQEYDYGNGGAFAVSYTLDLDREPDVDLVPIAERRAFIRNAQKHVDSNSVVIQVNGPVPRLSDIPGNAGQCDAAQVAMIDAAKSAAFDYVWSAKMFMEERYDRVPSEGGSYHFVFVPHPRYARWFGSHDSAEPMPGEPDWGDGDNAQVYETVDALLNRVVGGPGARLRPACGCEGYSPDTSAWSEDDTTYVVHFCPKFFVLPEFETHASRIGTIVHEYTHFHAYYPGRSDYAYGRNAAEQLAKSDRWKAVRNADNFEYFVTDTTPYEEDE
jgi:hypothetical protein